MTPDEIAVVRGELEAFTAEVFEPFARNDQRHWGKVYLQGLLTDGQRKSLHLDALNHARSTVCGSTTDGMEAREGGGLRTMP
ncbi:hypothetical protein [Streptomyces yanii]|uniref:Transposase n=1 Tax=Streptomyces yanii TaxID=78510 RepID=A0ABV5RPL1_9ACTN